MAAERRPRVLYRLCLYEDASHCTSFRRGHVTRASHPLVFSYPMPHRVQPTTFMPRA